MLFEKMMLWWWWIVSTVLSASNWLRYGKRRKVCKVCSQFPINKLPGAAISLILDRLSIHQLRTLQRVNRKFRRAVNCRWLLPGQPRSISIAGRRIHKEDEVEDDHPDQIWMSRFTMIIWDRQGGGVCQVKAGPGELAFRENFDAKLTTFSLSTACFQRFIHFFQTSSHCAEALLISSHVHRQPTVDTDPHPINVVPLLRSVRLTRWVDLRPLTNTFIRHFQANYRFDSENFSIEDGEYKLQDIVRCRRCRMDPWTDNLWSCASCTSMWNGEWLSGQGRSTAACHVRLTTFEPLFSMQLLTMVQLGFAPARPQQRGMSFVLTAREVVDHPSLQLINIPQFLQRLQRRVVTIYNGTMDVVDEMTDGAYILKKWMKKRGTEFRRSQLRACFQIGVANKLFFGGVIRDDCHPKGIHIVLLDQ